MSGEMLPGFPNPPNRSPIKSMARQWVDIYVYNCIYIYTYFLKTEKIVKNVRPFWQNAMIQIKIQMTHPWWL